MPYITDESTFELIQDSGRTLRFIEVVLLWTWSGWLEGTPSVEDVLEQIESLRERGAELGDVPTNSVFVALPEMSSALPPVACIAVLESDPVSSGEGADSSYAVIVWFQEQFSFPPDARARVEIAAIPWDRHALDGAI